MRKITACFKKILVSFLALAILFSNLSPLITTTLAAPGINRQIGNGADKVHIAFEREYENKPVVQVTMDSTIKLDDIDFQVKTLAGECEEDTGKEVCEEFLSKKLTGDFLINYSIVNVTEKGFDIILDTRAFQDLNFNWTAIHVKDAKKHESESSSSALTPTISTKDDSAN